MSFDNSPDHQNFHQTSSVIPDAYLSSDVIGAQSDDVIVTTDAGVMKKPDIDADIACNSLNYYQVSFLVYLKQITIICLLYTKLHL